MAPYDRLEGRVLQLLSWRPAQAAEHRPYREGPVAAEVPDLDVERDSDHPLRGAHEGVPGPEHLGGPLNRQIWAKMRRKGRERKTPLLELEDYKCGL